jgi:hypothetical protein
MSNANRVDFFHYEDRAIRGDQLCPASALLTC